MINSIMSPRRVSVSHPLVRDAYLKKNFTSENREEDVLVLDMVDDEHAIDVSSFDDYLVDLLTDLQSLKNQLSEKVGYFDRIDILTH